MISWIPSRYHRMCMVFGFLFPRIWYSSLTSPHFSSRTQIHWGVYRATDTGAVYRINYAQNCVVLCFVLVVLPIHYDDVIMVAVASQITSLTIFYSTVYSDADQRKHQSSASLAFVWGIHRGPVNSPQKWPVTRKMFPFDDVIMSVDHYDVITIFFRATSASVAIRKIATPLPKYVALAIEGLNSSEVNFIVCTYMFYWCHFTTCPWRALHKSRQ